jgi:hypothetical protein
MPLTILCSQYPVQSAEFVRVSTYGGDWSFWVDGRQTVVRRMRQECSPERTYPKPLSFTRVRL